MIGNHELDNLVLKFMLKYIFTALDQQRCPNFVPKFFTTRLLKPGSEIILNQSSYSKF